MPRHPAITIESPTNIENVLNEQKIRDHLLFSAAGDIEGLAAVELVTTRRESFFGISYNKKVKNTVLYGVDQLLEMGANPNYETRVKTTTLMQAASDGNPQTVASLLKNGALINTQDSFGSTALMEAVQSNKIDNVQAILEFDYAGYGMDQVDINLCCNNDGPQHICALSIARDNSNSEIAALLQRHGAIEYTSGDVVITEAELVPTIVVNAHTQGDVSNNRSNIPLASPVNSQSTRIASVNQSFLDGRNSR